MSASWLIRVFAMETPTDNTPAPPPARDRGLAAGGLLLIALAATLLLWPAMKGQLAFDDVLSIKQVQGFESWTDAFGSDAFMFYRPVKNLFFYAVVTGTPGDAIHFHLGTLAAYLTAMVGVFALSRRLGLSTPWALGAAAIWALSAANVTVALWTSCFNISVAAAAMCFGLLAWDRWREDPKRIGSLAGFILCFALGLLSYETAVAIAPLAVMIDLHRGRKVFARDSLLRYVGVALVVLAWIGLRYEMGAKTATVINPSFPDDMERWKISASAPYFLWTHFNMWAAPWGRLECLGNYLWNRSIPAAIVPFCWLLLIGAAVLAARFWRPGNLFVLGLAWFFIAAFPSGNFVPLGNTPYADYYTTIPNIGLAVSLAALLRALLGLARRTEGPARKLAWAAFALLVAWRGANLTEFRSWARAWSNPVEVMAHTAAVRPYQYLAKAAVAKVMLAVGEDQLARDYAGQSIEDNADLAIAHTVLGEVEFRAGNHAAALDHFTAAIDKRHLAAETLLDSHLRVGQIIGEDPARLEEAFQQHLLPVLRQRSYVRHPEAVVITAEVFRKAGERDHEIETLEKGLGYHPGNPLIAAALEEANRRGPASDGDGES